MVAAIVVSLAAAWGVGELTGYRRSLDHGVTDAPWFYGLFAAVVIAAAVTVDLVHNLVSLAIAVQVMNALLCRSCSGCSSCWVVAHCQLSTGRGAGTRW